MDSKTDNFTTFAGSGDEYTEKVRAWLQTDEGKAVMEKMRLNVERNLNPLYGIVDLPLTFPRYEPRLVNLDDSCQSDILWRVRGYGSLNFSSYPPPTE